MRFVISNDSNRAKCLINGKKIEYDACSHNDLFTAIETYAPHLFRYIGSSHIYFINGVKNVSKKQIHFFNER